MQSKMGSRAMWLALSFVVAGADVVAAEEATKGQSAALARAERIFTKVEELRGLKSIGPVAKKIISRAEFRASMDEMVARDLPPELIANLQGAYRAFGLIASDYDLLAGYLALLEGSVAGYYDQDTKALFILDDIPLDGTFDTTMAHELLHALEDQHFDFAKLMDETEALHNEDREFGLKGLLEGTATLLMTEYMMSGELDMMGMLGSQMSGMDEQTALLENAPLVMVRDLTVPYMAGMSLVREIQRRKGSGKPWARVAAAFANPPVSSEQVLHPKLYGRDFPVAIELPDLTPLAGAGWRQSFTNTLGELRISALADTMARKRGSGGVIGMDSGTNRVGTGWDGDRYALLVRGEAREESAIAHLSAWDTATDAREFFTFMHEVWLPRRHKGATAIALAREGLVRFAGDRGVIHLELDGDRVIVVAGLDEEGATSVALALAQLRTPADPREAKAAEKTSGESKPSPSR